MQEKQTKVVLCIMKKVQLRQIILVILLAVFCLSAYMIITHMMKLNSEKQAFKSLSKQVNADNAQNSSMSLTNTSQLISLAAQNNDLYGWVRIADTPIDYPVMHSQSDAEFYLNHGFDKKNL